MPGIDWAGTFELSWWDLQEFITHECVDTRSAFFRQINPDAETPETVLLRHVAQATADLRSLTASPMYEELPAEFGFVEFRWPGDEQAAAEVVSSAVEAEKTAIEVADTFR